MKFVNYLPVLFISSLFLFISNCSTAQPKNYSTKNKTAIKHYESALSAYRDISPQTGLGDLSGALNYVNKAISKDPNFVDAYLLKSSILSQQDKNREAVESIEKGLSINPEFSQSAYLNKTSLYMGMGDYENAKRSAGQFLSFNSTNEKMNSYARYVIKNCDFAIDLKKNPLPFEPVNLGENINTKYNEYFPTITGDGNTFLFTRRLPSENQRYEQEDFFITVKDTDGEWQISKSISKKINTFFNEGAPTLSADGKYLIFTSCEFMNQGYGPTRSGRGSCDLFYTKRIGNSWTTPRNIGLNVNTVHWESQPCFSSDGRTLYFIRGIKGRSGVDRNSQDIYVTHLSDDGKWQKPQKLSNKINTNGAEESVFIHQDGQTLYFASDGHLGMGGTDIFMSKLQADGSWGDPINLGYPINTHENENSILIAPDGITAYFASDREGGYGLLDLYSFKMPESIRPTYTTYIKGKVYNKRNNVPLQAEIELIDLESGKLFKKVYSDNLKGEFLINIPADKNLAFNVSKEGFFFYSKNYEFEANQEAQEVLIPLSPITETDETFVLENIFFDVNKYDLKSESHVELDKLFSLMEKNEEIKIEIGGHTDSDGNDDDNQVLSENRAKAVVNYLIKKGIAKERLRYKGYGEKKPIVPNTTAENKAQNRRTEVKIL